MIGKRFFLIAGGTVGGLGAVLSITPPQFGSSSGLALGTGTTLGTGTALGGRSSTPAATSTPAPASTPATAVTTPTPATTKKSTKKTKKPSKTGTKATSTPAPASTPQSTPAPATTPKSTPTPASIPKSTPTPVAAAINGTFTGDAGNTRYGPVQVQITVVDNKITKAVALTYPTGSFRDQQINQQAIPYLIQETLAAQSANIQGVGGATFTSIGWANSLQSAISKAGL